MTDYDEAYDIIDPWLVAVLSADSTITTTVGTRLASSLSGEVLDPPYIVWEIPSTRSIRGVGGVLLDTDSLVNIKVVAQGTSYGVASALRARMKALLDEKDATVSTPIAASLSSFWETNFRYPEVTEGVPYRHVGAAYRIRAVAL